MTSCVIEPYNTMMSMFWSIIHTQTSWIFDNESVIDICQKWLDLRRPTYYDINRVITRAITSITNPMRVNENNQYSDLREYQTNLVPFPRLHFLITSMSPIMNKQKIQKRLENEDLTATKTTELCLNPDSFLVELTYCMLYPVNSVEILCIIYIFRIDNFDAEEDKYTAAIIHYHGDIADNEADKIRLDMKASKKLTLVEWCPTGFKTRLYKKSPILLADDHVAPYKYNNVMMGNNTAISRFFGQRIVKKFDRLYSQRAYIHWYMNEGMEEGEFAEAREDLGFLEKDYLDVLSEQVSDDDTQ